MDERNRATIEDLRDKSDVLVKCRETMDDQDKVIQSEATNHSKFKQQALNTVRAIRDEKATALEEKEDALRLNNELLKTTKTMMRQSD